MEKDNLEILLEDIRGKFDLVLEGHDVLRKEILDSKHELHEEIDLVNIKIEALNTKIDGVKDELNSKIDSVNDSLNAKIDSVNNGLNAKIGGVEARLSTKIDGVKDELSMKIGAVATDLKAHRSDMEVHKKVYKVQET